MFYNYLCFCLTTQHLDTKHIKQKNIKLYNKNIKFLIFYYFLQLRNFSQGAVYIQIIRSSTSLCAITEAHDIGRNCWIL